MTMLRVGSFGFSRRGGEQPVIVMTSLVDIMLATIGIFVIVYALQEIAPPTTRVPAPFDGAILCNAEGQYSFHDLEGGSQAMARTDLAASLARIAPVGGRFLIGIAPGCASKSIDKRTHASDLAYAMRRKLGLQTVPSGEPLHQFEITPIGTDKFAFEALLELIRPTSSNPGPRHNATER